MTTPTKPHADAPFAEGPTPARLPRISIITACQNDEQGIARCVASVAAQTHPNVEHVVVLLPGHDHSLAQLLEHQHRLTIVFAAANENLPQAWNRGIKQATGELIGFLGPYDTLADASVLESVAQAFQDPWISALYGDSQRRSTHSDTTGRVYRSGVFSRKRLSWGWSPPMNALFVRRLWLTRIGGFSPQLPVAAHYDAMLRLFSQPFFKAVYQPRPLVHQAPHPWRFAQLLQRLRRPLEEFRALRQAQLGGPGSLGFRYLAKLARPRH